MSLLPKTLGRVAAFSYENSRWLLGVALTLSASTPFLLAGLRIDSDAAKLIPASDPVGIAYRQSRAAFGESNPVVIELRHEHLSATELDELTDRLADTLASWADIQHVTARAFDLTDSESAAWRLRAALRNSDPGQLESFRARFTPDGMRRALLRTRKRLVALDDPRLRSRLADDPLGVGAHIAAFEEPRVAIPRGQVRSAYFESSDGRSRLLYVQPTGSAEDTRYCRQLLERIRMAVRETGRGTSSPAGLEHRVTGVHAATAESSEVLVADLVRITAVATASLFALLWLAFRRLRTALLCFLPLLVAQLAVLAIARLLFNPINPLTIGFAAVVVGLGLDIGLHMTARLAQFLDSSTLEVAVRSTFADAGPPVLVGAISTSLAFLALLATGNRGLVQFGVLNAAGLLLTLLATLVLFPALARHLLRPASSQRDLTLRGSPAPLLDFVSRRPRTSFAIGLALAAIALPFAARFRFDTEVSGLFPPGLAAADVAREIGEAHGVRPGAQTLVTIRAPNVDSAMTLQRDVDRRLSGLVAEGAVSLFESPSRYLTYPSPPAAEAIWSSTGQNVATARETFFALLQGVGFRVEPFHRTYYDTLVAATASIPPDRDLLGDQHLDRFARATADGVLLQTYVVTASKGDEVFGFDAEATRNVSRELRSIQRPTDASLEVTGLVQVYERAQDRLVGDFARVSWIALILVGGVSFIFFRRLAPSLLTFLPLAAALPTTLAATIWLDVTVMPFAISFLAIVVGIGIDDAVHLLARIEASPEHAALAALREIGTVITLTTLSTVLGFGALALSRLPVVASLGVIVALGVTTCWLFCLLLLPEAIRWARGGRALVIVASCSLLAIGSAEARDQPDRVSEILEGMRKAFDSMETVSCDIDLVKSIEQLRTPIELHGTLTVQKPASIKLELDGDERLSLLSDGETAWLVDHDLDEVEAFSLDRQDRRTERLFRLLPSVFFLEREEIEEGFDVSSLPPDIGKYRLELVPRPSQGAAFTRLVVDLSRNYRPKRMHTEYANADSVTTELAGCRHSKRLPASSFRHQER